MCSTKGKDAYPPIHTTVNYRYSPNSQKAAQTLGLAPLKSARVRPQNTVQVELGAQGSGSILEDSDSGMSLVHEGFTKILFLVNADT